MGCMLPLNSAALDSRHEQLYVTDSLHSISASFPAEVREFQVCVCVGVSNRGPPKWVAVLLVSLQSRQKGVPTRKKRFALDFAQLTGCAKQLGTRPEAHLALRLGPSKMVVVLLVFLSNQPEKGTPHKNRPVSEPL